MGTVSNNEGLLRLLQVDASDTRLLEVQTNLLASATFRSIGAHQESMANVAYISNLIGPCQELGLRIEDAIKREAAATLWDREEFIPAIRILQELAATGSPRSQSIPVGKADILATLVGPINQNHAYAANLLGTPHFLCEARKA